MTVVGSLEGSEYRHAVNCVHKVAPFLRLSYCRVVEIDLRALIVENDDDFNEEDLRGVILDDLDFDHAAVGKLIVLDDRGTAGVVTRIVAGFKSVAHVALVWKAGEMEPPGALSLQFFQSLIQGGVHTCDIRTADHATFVDACEFLGRDVGGIELSLCLDGDSLADDFEDFLPALLEKSGKIEAGTRISFKLLINVSRYYFDNFGGDDEDFVEAVNRLASVHTKCAWSMGSRWTIDDLQNGVKLEIEQFEKNVGWDTMKMLQINVCSTH